MKKEITVKTTSVYDARALAELVGLASSFTSKITVLMGSRQINAKSIMGVMGLGLDVGKEVIIDAEGSDEAQAIEAMEVFFTK